jgi:hypothetical protein
MSVIESVVEAGIYGRLTSMAGTAVWGTRVYEGMADLDDPNFDHDSAYVVFSLVAGGYDNKTPSNCWTLRYQIDCWAPTKAIAKTGLGHIDTATLNSALTLATGYKNYQSLSVGRIRTDETEGGRTWYRRGSEVQFRVDIT